MATKSATAPAAKRPAAKSATNGQATPNAETAKNYALALSPEEAEIRVPADKVFPKETYLKWYNEMQMIRKFEDRSAQLYGQQKIKGFCHLYIGQEAILAGAYSVINPDDRVITAYRDHGHALICGLTPGSVMAELYGKATGCSKGKGGSMHMFSKEHSFFGGHGIVGGQIPLGAGLAFADWYRGEKQVTLCYMGDGALRQGALHETFNMAMVMKLPVVFICENNFYAMGTSLTRSSNVKDIYTLGEGYDMPAAWVDGMNPEAVHCAMEIAVEQARSGEGPFFLEIRTYRFKGHSMSDPAKYRTKEELEEYRMKDPISRVMHTLIEKHGMTEADFEAIDAKIMAEIEEAVQFAEESPWPTEDELFKDVYVQEDYPFIRD